MLVLSRRANDKVVFPHLGITLEILRISGSNVRIGVTAPPEVAVLRQELADRDGVFPRPELAAAEGRKLSHEMRNCLQRINLALHITHKQLELGRVQEADETLAKALAEIQRLDDSVAAQRQKAASLPQRILRRALLVEDDRNESELLAGVLRLSGYKVDTAHDGCDALDYLSSHDRPDVVLMDMQLPRCDGPSTVRAIRHNPAYAGLKVYAVSGMTPQDAPVAIGPQGVDRWFCKPLNPQTLLDTMEREITG